MLQNFKTAIAKIGDSGFLFVTPHCSSTFMLSLRLPEARIAVKYGRKYSAPTHVILQESFFTLAQCWK